MSKRKCVDVQFVLCVLIWSSSLWHYSYSGVKVFAIHQFTDRDVPGSVFFCHLCERPVKSKFKNFAVLSKS